MRLTRAITDGDLSDLERLLQAQPDLAIAVLDDGQGRGRTPLHLVADWPGYHPDGPAAVRLLIGAGADPDAPAPGPTHAETPLHAVASTDDVDVAEALLDGGAQVDGGAASLAGGTPLADAVGYGSWHVARLLSQRGAAVDRLWVAAAIGDGDAVDAFLGAGAGRDEITEAFWHACHGGQRRVAARLLAAGANLDGRPPYAHDGAVAIAAAPDVRRAGLVAWLEALGGMP